MPTLQLHDLYENMNMSEEQYSSHPGLATLLWRGFTRKCPRCGEGKLFNGYLKLVDNCSHCGLELGEMRADDFPPYLTMVVVGHIVVPGALLVEKHFDPTIPFQLAIWLPATLILALWFLPRLKGSIVGLMMHVGLKGGETN